MRLTTEREEIALPTHCYSALKWALAVQCSKHLKKKNEQLPTFYYRIYTTLPTFEAAFVLINIVVGWIKMHLSST